MPLSTEATSALNKAVDKDTFGFLATAVAARVASVTSLAISGEQKFNSIKDEISLDKMVAHFRSQYNASLPATNIPAATDKINASRDHITLAHVVKYLKATAAVTISLPTNSVAPVITGTGNGPFTVSNPGTWSNTPDSYTYQWQRDGVNVGGATTSTLPKHTDNNGTAVRCVVKGVNPAGPAASGANSNAINAYGIPVNTVLPAISGTGTGPFTSTSGTWTNTTGITYTYQWQGDGVDLAGKTTNTLADDVAYDGVDITCDVIAHNASGDSAEATSNTITGAA